MQEENERMAIVETKLDHLAEVVDALKVQNDDMKKTIDTLKGVKWSMLAVASFVGWAVNEAITIYLGKH